ncbi:uncharacterized protein RHO17_006272 [Thomomys bottae]
MVPMGDPSGFSLEVIAAEVRGPRAPRRLRSSAGVRAPCAPGSRAPAPPLQGRPSGGGERRHPAAARASGRSERGGAAVFIPGRIARAAHVARVSCATLAVLGKGLVSWNAGAFPGTNSRGSWLRVFPGAPGSGDHRCLGSFAGAGDLDGEIRAPHPSPPGDRTERCDVGRWGPVPHLPRAPGTSFGAQGPQRPRGVAKPGQKCLEEMNVDAPGPPPVQKSGCVVRCDPEGRPSRLTSTL